MPDYLKYFPSPLLDDLVKNRCLPIVGAGFSRNAQTPLGRSLPVWDGLGRELAKALSQYDYVTAVDALSAFEFEFGRSRLVEELARLLLVHSAKPGTAHGAFARLPFQEVITTNFDFLLEAAFAASGRYCRPVLDEDHLSVAGPDPSVALIKLHGDVNHPDRLVVTERDYDSFLERYPLVATYVSSLLIRQTPLFIGYSLDDPDFRGLLQVVADRLGVLKRPAYTIRVGSSTVESARFARRGVKVIDLPAGRRSANDVLTDAFNELSEYWRDQIAATGTTTNDSTVAELTADDETRESRLCLILFPPNPDGRLYTYYRQEVFPVAERYGFVPVTPFDVLTPQGNWFATADTLASRSAMLIVDLAYPFPEGMGLAWRAAAQGRSVRLVVEQGQHHAQSEDAVSVVELMQSPNIDVFARPADLDAGDSHQFVARIADWLASAAGSLHEALNAAPQRLLDRAEYNFALVAAISLLEQELTTRLDIKGPVRQMVESAVRQGHLTRRHGDLVERALVLRNRIVHTAANVRAQDAAGATRHVLEAVSALRTSG